ncbi:MAG TPA: HEPN domain-containing protein [Methanocella sp.]|uniref:HEPN domain-containing protein n=1 Tax=Methanocella sp. TaxID=2052833 RepID=UPI002CBFC862|nr:HEPN domain-containing protein [Methanocella sp.]HTY91739.1 HEPN domain-containing protein [Methanocella sp.]
MRRPAKEEALRWLTQAKDEFDDAGELRKRGRFYLALFHFQQAAEKALKAYLYLGAKSTEIFRLHSIGDHAEMAFDMDPDYEKVKNAKKLDKYYFITRYPNGLPGDVPSRFFDDPEEAEEAMRLAKIVVELAERKINAST